MNVLRKAIHKVVGGREEFDSYDNSLFADAKVGIEVKNRLGPMLCEYIETQAQETRIRALERLEKVSPTDAAAVATLQVEAKAAAKALTWLVNAVERGVIAEEQLRQRDEE
jgi:hypothetical protein